MSNPQVQHPVESELLAFAGGRLSGPQSDAVARHLRECEACAAALRELKGAEADDASELTEIATTRVDSRERGGQGPGPVTDDDTSLTPRVETRIVAYSGAPESISESASADESVFDPRFIGRYRVTGKLGAGAFGAVYRAFDENLKRDVAIKVPHRERYVDAEHANLYLAEAQALAKLDHHPHIVPVYDFGQLDDGRCYLVSKFVDGLNLAEWLKRAPPGPDEAARMTAAIADALHHAHLDGLVHRDVKPANILLDEKARPWLADFGLTLHEEDFGSGPRLAGSPAYMSPEQARGEGDRVDGRSDIFSLGVVFYEMLTGSRPFPGRSPHEIMENVKHGEFRPPRQRNDTIPAELERVCLKAMSKRTSERYTIAKDMAEDLWRFLSGGGRSHDQVQEGGALASAPAPSQPRHNLPAQVTSFIGRENEIHEVRQLLDKTKLLTLTGVGGCGKTRLAVQVGASLAADYSHGVWLVELAAVGSGSQVVEVMAQVLSVREESHRPLMESVVAKLADQRALLLLDNCEHVIDACAQLADTLLSRCDGVRMLATSRESLRAAGEISWRVPSFATPESGAQSAVEDVARFDSVRLFVDRAQSLNQQFKLSADNTASIAQICRRLDGIPLALELAAARTTALSPTQIAARLDDRFRLLTGGRRAALRRQQTLAAAIAWSYDLLEDDERELFHRLAVFAGEFNLDAAEAICADERIPAMHIVDLLDTLVAKSLVATRSGGEEVQYRLLETLRAYAAERLAASGETAPRFRRHFEHYLSLACQEETARLECHLDDVHAALAWGIENDAHACLPFGVAMGGYWLLRGLWSQGMDFLSRLLDAPVDNVPEEYLSKLLWWQGAMAYRQGSLAKAAEVLKTCLDLCQRCEDQPGTADALNALGLLAWDRSELPAARSHHDQSLAMARQLNDQRRTSRAMNNLAVVVAELGEFDSARQMTEDALAIDQAAGNCEFETIELINLGRYAFESGDAAEGRRLIEQGVSMAREIGHTYAIVYGLNPLGSVARSLGEEDTARALYEECLDICRGAGNLREMAYALKGLGDLSLAAGRLEAAREYCRQGLQSMQTLENKRGMAAVLESFAGLWTAEDRCAAAVKLLGAAHAVRNVIHAPLPPSQKPKYDRCLESLRTALSEAEFIDAWREGEGLAPEHAVSLALADHGE